MKYLADSEVDWELAEGLGLSRCLCSVVQSPVVSKLLMVTQD